MLLTVAGFTRAAGATVTSLRTSPASPVAHGSPVTLTATMTPATAAGTVQFKDGTTNLGKPVTVSNGTASGSTSTLAGGSHQLTAVFIPTDPMAFRPSTLSPVNATYGHGHLYRSGHHDCQAEHVSGLSSSPGDSGEFDRDDHPGDGDRRRAVQGRDHQPR